MNLDRTGIQHCTRLLSIAFRFHSPKSQRRATREWVMVVLGQLPSPNRSLTRITFIDELPVDEALAHLEGLKLDDVLAEGTFEGLGEIVLSLKADPSTCVEVLKELSRIFEKAVSRHIVLSATVFAGGGGRSSLGSSIDIDLRLL